MWLTRAKGTYHLGCFLIFFTHKKDVTPAMAHSRERKIDVKWATSCHAKRRDRAPIDEMSPDSVTSDLSPNLPQKICFSVVI